LSRADTISATERDDIRRRVADLAPQAAWCESIHAASGLVDAAGETRPISMLAGRRVVALCGIGNPAGFRHTLSTLGCDIVAWRAFPDHHSYSPADVAALQEMVAGSQAEYVVSTHKDLVKLRALEIGGVHLWAVSIEMRFLSGQEMLEQALARCLAPA
jgi:tetraacyldisaccharide 4'-kinase